MPQDKVPLLIFVNKGIETGTQALTLEIIAEACGTEVAKVSTFLVGLTIAWRITRWTNVARSPVRPLRKKASHLRP